MNDQFVNGSHTDLGVKCDIQTWHTCEDGKGDKIRKVVASRTGDEDTLDSRKHALVVERGFERKGHLAGTTLSVNSSHILEALREAHHWENLSVYKCGLRDDADDSRMHLNLLLGFLESELGESKISIEKQFASGRCEFSNVWLLFKPGDAVVTHFGTHPWLLTVFKTAYMETHYKGKWLDMRYFAKKKLRAGPSEDILKLPVYPRRYYAEGETLEERLRARGHRYLALSSGPSVQNYNGVAEYLKEIPPEFFHPDQSRRWQIRCSYAERGRVVFDLASWLEENYGPEASKPEDTSVLDTALCPPYAFGYSCGRKQWGRFPVANAQETAWRPDPMSKPEMKMNQKMLIQALVSSHEFANHDRDQMGQKRKGLVILLHGPPGSGKTLTAECAAELSQRALLSCSMSELNKHNSAWYFEQRLAQVLQLATTWKAVVLLDEADVFLEARQDNSPVHQHRNALVAVFLRHLEYFSGIVFLTTNRIHVFDGAMRSRVHLALGYHEPDAAARRARWSYNIHNLPKEQVDASLADMLDRLASEPLNGREIANMVATANTFARSRMERLQFHHIETVLTVRRDFDVVLNNVKSAGDHT
ncbi:uncharacterized protein PG986_013891 [Apiospora aurea]|uniref:AAA+ ATPase domain-containing protein n=1 Tax=Apiospora aurea TaxID=335848 RepID=A0ABR1PWV6_9PEZI